MGRRRHTLKYAHETSAKVWCITLCKPIMDGHAYEMTIIVALSNQIKH